MFVYTATLVVVDLGDEVVGVEDGQVQRVGRHQSDVQQGDGATDWGYGYVAVSIALNTNSVATRAAIGCSNPASSDLDLLQSLCLPRTSYCQNGYQDKHVLQKVSARSYCRVLGHV